jgi:hypothetical protein
MQENVFEKRVNMTSARPQPPFLQPCHNEVNTEKLSDYLEKLHNWKNKK